jgi:hypothetical protein
VVKCKSASAEEIAMAMDDDKEEAVISFQGTELDKL